VRWTRVKPKEYIIKNPKPQYLATVFGSPRGFDWAWGVWHQGGVDAGIEITFRAARNRAEEIIEKLAAQS
jgi:hypothetical protein